jgi:hypothetical protein
LGNCSQIRSYGCFSWSKGYLLIILSVTVYMMKIMVIC